MHIISDKINTGKKSRPSHLEYTCTHNTKILHWDVSKEIADAFSVVCSPDSLRQSSTDIDYTKLWAAFDLVTKRDCVCDNNIRQTAFVQSLYGVSRKDTMCDNGNDFHRTVVLDGLRGLGQSTACISHVVDKDGNLVRNVSNKDHAANLIGTRTLLVDQRKALVDAIGNGGSSGWG